MNSCSILLFATSGLCNRVVIEREQPLLKRSVHGLEKLLSLQIYWNPLLRLSQFEVLLHLSAHQIPNLLVIYLIRFLQSQSLLGSKVACFLLLVWGPTVRSDIVCFNFVDALCLVVELSLIPIFCTGRGDVEATVVVEKGDQSSNLVLVRCWHLRIR